MSFTKEGDIVIVGSDGVFDNLYLAPWPIQWLGGSDSELWVFILYCIPYSYSLFNEELRSY